MKVLALSPVPFEGAGCRYRVAQYIPYLAEQGIDLTVAPFYDSEFFSLVYRPGQYLRKARLFLRQTLGRVRTLLRHARYDLVLVYREALPVGPPAVEALLDVLKVPLVFDFDDAVFLPNTSEANRRIAALKYPQKTSAIIRRSAEVIAGNEYLADYARRFNASVHVIPTAIDVTRFVPRATPRPPGTPLVVGWIGTPTTVRYLSPLEPILRELSMSHALRFRIAGATSDVRIDGVEIDNVPWSLETEVDLFNGCDIGVYPLPDDEWARGKCGFKAIQFMSCAVPVVASPVGVNREIIQDGVNGFLAGTADEWRTKLGALLGDAALRHRIGAAGRVTIEERYSLQVNAPRVAAVLGQALERAHGVPRVGPTVTRTAEARAEPARRRTTP
jgi:glycosyltransferase involved in cell wall biosynthesis